VLVMCRKPII